MASLNLRTSGGNRKVLGITKINAKDYCEKCPGCQEFAKWSSTLIMYYVPCIYPLKRYLMMDFTKLTLTDMPGIMKESVCILVLVEPCSRYAWTYVSRNESAADVANILQYLKTKEYPEMQMVKSDNGSNFIANAVKDLASILVLNLIRSRAYTPRSNGRVERLNRTLKDMIGQRVIRNFTDKNERKQDFKDIVQATMAATSTYNNRFHITLICTPATLFLANNVTDTALNMIYLRHASRQRKGDRYRGFQISE